jgi:hypothetical protein
MSERVVSQQDYPGLGVLVRGREFKRMRVWAAGSILAAVIALVYVYPYVSALNALEYRGLPPSTGADQYLYLNLAELEVSEAGTITNPWYGTELGAMEPLYARYMLSLRAFDLLHDVTSTDLAGAFLVWQAMLIFVLGFLFFVFFYLSSPGSSIVPLAIATCLAMFVNVSETPAAVGAWLDVLAGRPVDSPGLPYMRFPNPQFAAFLLVLYLIFQLIALHRSRLSLWLALVLVQFLALVSYIFLVPILALTTGLALVMLFLMNRTARDAVRLNWSHLALYIVLGLGVDLAYLLLVGRTSESSLLGFGTLLQVRLAEIPDLVGLAILLLSGLAAAAMIIGRRRSRAALLLGALGVSIVLLDLMEVVLDPRLGFSAHIEYFVNTALTLLIGYLIVAAYAEWAPRLPAARWIAAGVLVVLVLHAGLTASALASAIREGSRGEAALAAQLAALELGQQDLIIAPARTVDDVSAWTPLISPARVLYTRNAEFVLSQAGRMEEHQSHQAIYLYLIGKDREWLDEVLDPSNKETQEQSIIVPVSLNPSLKGESRLRTLSEVNNVLGPMLTQVEQDSGRVNEFLNDYDRVVIIDRVNNSLFSKPVLDKHLDIHETNAIGPFTLSIASPRRK